MFLFDHGRGGGGGASHTPYLSAWRSASQTISTSTNTNIVWNQTITDTDSILNTSTGIVTIPETADYIIHARARFTYNATGTRHFKIVTGGDTLAFDEYEPGTAISTYMKIFWFGNITASTILAISCWQNTGGNLSLNVSDQENCGFYIWKIT